MNTRVILIWGAIVAALLIVPLLLAFGWAVYTGDPPPRFLAYPLPVGAVAFFGLVLWVGAHAVLGK